MKSHVRKVYACLAVTYHLRFWQNDRDLLLATAVTRGWKGYHSQHINDHGEDDPAEENVPPVPAGIRTRDVSSKSPAL